MSRLPLTVTVSVLFGSAHVAHALDDGLDAPIPDAHEIAPEPSPLGPDGTYGSFHDVRIRFGRGGGTWNADLEPLFGTATSRTGTVAAHTSLRIDSLHSSGLHPGGGWLWGIGGAFETMSGPLVGANASLQATSFELVGGWALPVGSHVELELLALDDIGFGSMTDDFTGSPMRTLSGIHLCAGAEANLVITHASGLQLAASMGLRYAETHLNSDDSTYSAKVTATGWNAGVSLGERF